MDSDDRIMLYLYKESGLLWEHTIKLDANGEMCSIVINKELKKYLNKDSSIIYNITNAKDLDQKPVQENEFYFTDAKSSIVRSLAYHLRNSIMHGLYEIIHRKGNIFIDFKDIDPRSKLTTLRGIVELNRLKKMMSIIRKF